MDMRVLEREVRERTGDRAAGISIDQVRALQPLLQSTPALSPWRAIIVDSIDDLARAAANALLKSLEEPPPATIFLLVSHAPRSEEHTSELQSLMRISYAVFCL